jgi:tetratricopeptide (TPR) repeat protein
MGSYFALPPLGAAGLPTVTVEEETLIHFNGEAIRLMPVPGAHTSGDLVVHFTGSGVACVGDLVFTGSFPNADPNRGGNARRLIEVLRLLVEVLPADTRVVPGHGDELTLDELGAYVKMVEDTVAAIQREVSAGRDLEQVLAREPLARWSAWSSPDGPPDLVSWTTEAYAGLTGDVRRSICEPVTEVLVRNGHQAAVAEYRRLVAEEPDAWSFGEDQLNALGYQLLARERVEEAIAIFELNVEAFPEASNPYDSLGEAYMTAGRTELAIANYERSLELDPGNDNAVAMLARLRGE